MQKSIWTSIGVCSAMFVLIMDGKTALEGAQQGIELCYKTVIPSLFPFLFLSVILTASMTGNRNSRLRPLGKLFQTPEGSESILVSALFGGYPAGAHCIRAAWNTGVLSRENAQRMLPYCNNAGPAFIFGMVSHMFPESWMVWALWLIHVFSGFLVSRLSSASPQASGVFNKKSISIADAMGSALSIMAQICGWVILFRIILSFLSRWVLWLLPIPMQVLISGFLELSNGCWELQLVSSIPLRFILCSGMLSFGGICVIMQTMSAAKGLSMRCYLQGKLMQTLFSILLSAAFIFHMWIIIAAIMTYFLIISYKSKNNCGNMERVHV